MTESYAQRTVGDIVTEQPGRSRLFERLGIDYCCGGNRTLSEACRAKGLDPDDIARRIDRLDTEDTGATEPDYATMPLAELADHIVSTHHVYLREELPRIDGLVRKVAEAHSDSPSGPQLRELVGLMKGLIGELQSHMLKEERILFPLIHRLDTATGDDEISPGMLDGPISVMEQEHDNAGRALGRVRELTADFTIPDWACNTYRAMLDALLKLELDLHQHIHKENNILFPRTRAALERSAKTQG